MIAPKNNYYLLLLIMSIEVLLLLFWPLFLYLTSEIIFHQLIKIVKLLFNKDYNQIHNYSRFYKNLKSNNFQNKKCENLKIKNQEDRGNNE